MLLLYRRGGILADSILYEVESYNAKTSFEGKLVL